MLSVNEINLLEAQNKGLKKQNQELQKENTKLKQAKDKYYQQTLDDEIQINELLQTLQEIKEIAEFHTTQADSEDVQEDMKQILQKITECEVNE